MEWTGCVDEYEKLVNRMNKPRVVIDNASCETATLVKVDSARKRGILLEAVQVLTDLELSISKAYISSDGRWFMDVFHVTDPLGLKLSDPSLLSSLEQSLSSPVRTGAVHGGSTALELTGTDRPGLLSEVFAVLSDLRCVVEKAKVWTHNGRIAALMSVSGAVDAKALVVTLRSVLRGDGDVRSATAAVSSACGVTHAERRLHQMMFADRDYERHGCATAASPPLVAVQNWVERGYSIVSVHCLDRPKLLFDIVCTLTDMDYVVFHGTIDTDGDRARQEFYIRHADGSPISSEAERQRVIQCLQAAIERRESKGLPLELTVVDRPCLLSDVTRTFRENGLSITKAEISTECDVATNVFYVTDSTGNSIDEETVHAIRQRIGCDCLRVRRPLPVCDATSSRQQETAAGNGGLGLFSIGSLVRRNLYNLGLIRSCS